MQRAHFRTPILAICLALLVVIIAACDDSDYGPRPTPVHSPTPGPTIVPTMTVGPLNTININQLGISLLAPSTWKPPAAKDDHSVVMSLEGSTDTTVTAGPFIYIIVGSKAYFHSKLSFPLTVDTPTDFLNAIISGINDDEPDMGFVQPYTDAHFPGATVTYLVRGNKNTITVLKAADDLWVYVGTQSSDTYFGYYQGMVFKPAIDSITLNSAQTPVSTP